MVSIRRVSGSKNPAEMTYYVQHNGTPLSGSTAAKVLNTVDSQTMALTLGYFVQLQAERKNCIPPFPFDRLTNRPNDWQLRHEKTKSDKLLQPSKREASAGLQWAKYKKKIEKAFLLSNLSEMLRQDCFCLGYCASQKTGRKRDRAGQERQREKRKRFFLYLNLYCIIPCCAICHCVCIQRYLNLL